MLNDLNGRKTVVGVKQTKKAVLDGRARRVFVAADAERRVTTPLLEACAERDMEVEEAGSMRELGAACGITIGAAAAAVIG